MADSVIYLDYNATTPLAPEVIKVITQSLQEHWTNPSSSYDKVSKLAIKNAREQIANMINSSTEDIVFTSGGTESNNIVFYSVTNRGINNSNKRGICPHIIASCIEHVSVLSPLQQLESDGVIELTILPLMEGTGAVTVDSIMNAIQPNTVLVTVMLANNETGAIQPVREICEAIGKHNESHSPLRILVHSDAAQAIGKIPVDVQQLGVDYLTIVGHKFYGPRIGALYVRDLTINGTPYHPLLYGGRQERGYRPGTENTPMIVGLGKAAQLVTDHLSEYNCHMKTIRDYLESQLQTTFGDQLHFNSHFSVDTLPNTCNVSLIGSGLEGIRCHNDFIIGLGDDVIMISSYSTGFKILSLLKHCQASAGAACHSDVIKPSSVLLATGIPDSIAINALRISVGRQTTTNDIDLFIEDLKDAIKIATTQ